MSRRNDAGFTLIELLIVVVIIGILAAIAIPKFSNTKGATYLASMRTDLRNLATAEEAYMYDNNVYYIGPLPGPGIPATGSAGVTLTITEATAGGWSATATHAQLPGRTCAIFIGTAAPVTPATVSGAITCN